MEFYKNKKDALAFVDRLAKSNDWIEINAIAFQASTLFGLGRTFVAKRVADLETFGFVEVSNGSVRARVGGDADDKDKLSDNNNYQQ